MKKRILSLFLVVIMLGSMLVGCAKGEDKGSESIANTTQDTELDANTKENSSDGTEASVEPVNITFYSTQTGMDQDFMKIIAQFETENPDIKVEYIAAGDDQLQKWMSLYASNEGPSVSLMDPINIWENKERMLVLDPAQNAWMDNVYEDAYSVYTYDGNIYGIPISTQGYGILYNQRILDGAVGGTFNPDTIKSRDDLRELFDQIEATGVAATMITGVNWSIGAHFLGLTYTGYRGDSSVQAQVVTDSKAGTFDLENDNLFNGLMETFDLLAEYNYNKEDPLVGNVDIDAEAFATGKTGTWFQGDWSWVQIKDVAGRDEEFGIIPIPVSNDKNDRNNTIIPASQPKGYCIDASQNSVEQQEASKKFIEFICFNEFSQQIMCDTMGATLPYKNTTVKSNSPLAAATSSYVEQGRTNSIYGFSLLLPSDFWYENGASMEQYLAGRIDRKTLASQISQYWVNQN